MLPTKEEGFDEIKFVWNKEAESEKYLKAWKTEMKLTQRVDELQPGAWFKDNWSDWQGILQQWRRAQNDFKNPPRRREPPKKRAKKDDEKKDGEKADGKDGKDADAAENGDAGEKAADEDGKETAKDAGEEDDAE